MVNYPWIAQNIIITLDFDGCIAIGDHVKIKYSKIIHGIDLKPEEATKEKYPYPYSDNHLRGLTKEQVNRLSDEDKNKVKENAIKYQEMVEIASGEKILEHKLDPRCKQVLISLYKQGFRFVIVTSREGKLFEACKKFVKYHKLPISYFHGTGRKGTEYVPKDVFVKKLRSRAMIDDTLYKLSELVRLPVQLFFLVRPWSRNEISYLTPELKKRIKVIYNWGEFYQELINMKELHEAICYYNHWKNDWTTMKDIFNFWNDNKKLCEDYLKEYRKEIKVA